MDLSLTVTLDRQEPSPTYRPGDVIHGQVHVRAGEACRCDGLTVSLVWYTHGKGNKSEKAVQDVPLFKGEWQAAADHAYPFQLPVPAGPYTHRGTLLNIDWLVKTRADVPWAIDPKAEAELLVVPWDGNSLQNRTPSHYRDAPVVMRDEFETGEPIATPAEVANTQRSAIRGMLGCGGMLIACGAGAAAVGAVGESGSIGNLASLMLVGLVLVAIGLWKHWVSAKLGGEQTVLLEPEVVEVGDSFDLTVRFAVPRTTELERAVATFRGKEVAISGSGSNKRTFEEPLHEEVTELATAGTLLAAGAPTELRARFAVPPTAVYSFEAQSNKLRWEVELEIDPKGAPAWKRVQPLTVRPLRLERLREPSG